MSDIKKKAFPLWEIIKNQMVESLNSAQISLNRYRDRRNNRDLRDFKQRCVSAFIHIHPYKDMFKKKEDRDKMEELEAMMGEIPEDKTFGDFLNYFKFLSNAYRRLGVTDIAKMEDEDSYKTAVLEGMFDA